MSDLIILQALQGRVIETVAGSSVPALPIKGVSIPFEPPNDQKWLELVFLPNEPGELWGDKRNYRGAMRLILHWPNDGAGPYVPIALLAEIGAGFLKDALVDGVQIIAAPFLTGVLDGGTETLYPSTVRYTFLA